MLSRDLAGEDSPVVAVTIHAAGIARDAVLAEPRRGLVDGAAEVDPGNGRALPERGLCRELGRAPRRHAELCQVAYGTRESGRPDDVLDLEDELRSALRPAR